MKYLFLPPYSPDFNPIELTFSAIKAFIRRNGAFYQNIMTRGSTEEICAWLAEAVWAVTPADAKAWIIHTFSIPII
jgi:transposase